VVGQGDPELTHWSLSLVEGFYFYFERSDENDQLSVLNATAGVNGARSSADLSVSFEQLRQNTRDIRFLGSLVRRDQLDVKLTGRYEFSPKTAMAAGVEYGTEDFKVTGFGDLRRTQFPIDLSFEVSPRLDVTVAHQLQESQRSGFEARFRDHFLNVGAQGELTPKVSGSLRVGLTRRDASPGGSEDTLGLDGTLSWEISPKVRVETGLSRDFASSSLTGETYRRTELSVRGSYEVALAWSAGATGRLEYARYARGRKDDLSTGSLFVRYQPGKTFGFSAEWTYEFNHSNAAFARFEQNTISVTAMFQY